MTDSSSGLSSDSDGESRRRTKIQKMEPLSDSESCITFEYTCINELADFSDTDLKDDSIRSSFEFPNEHSLINTVPLQNIKTIADDSHDEPKHDTGISTADENNNDSECLNLELVSTSSSSSESSGESSSDSESTSDSSVNMESEDGGDDNKKCDVASDYNIDLCPKTRACTSNRSRRSLSKSRKMDVCEPLYKKLLKCRLLRRENWKKFACCRRECDRNWMRRRLPAEFLGLDYARSDLNVCLFSWGVWKSS